MNLKDYENKALEFRIPSADKLYVLLGLIGELGELYGKMAKGLRDEDEIIVDPKEVGDVFWFLVMLCHDHGIDPDKVLEDNIAKLASRKARNTLQGSGDDR